MRSERSGTCCFSGHRPEKIFESEQKIKTALLCEIKKSIGEGYTTFISGMANGFDLWAAGAVIELKKEGAPVALICALPFPGFNRNNSGRLTEFANETVCVCEKYVKSSFSERNKWMVDRSAKLISYYNGEAGGTRSTVLYAEKSGVRVVNLFLK